MTNKDKSNYLVGFARIISAQLEKAVQSRKMSTHLRSTLRRALLLANKNGPVSIVGQKAALGNTAQSQQLKPSKFENNIVLSPYPDCQFHDLTLTQKFFESAVRWPDKIALVSDSVKDNNSILIHSLS